MKTVKVEPLTRVEGHGRVELNIRDSRLEAVRVALVESPRLFEALVLGRSFAEVPALVCRICSICSSVHRIAAASALEDALGADVPPAAREVRELLLLGGHIESHALHLFCLVLPDLGGTPSILEMLRAGDPVARAGVSLKALGNRIQEVAGGRVIHPVNVEVGGVLRLPEREKLEGLLRDLEEWEERLPSLLAPFFAATAWPPAGEVVGKRLAVAPVGETFGLIGGDLLLSDGRRLPGDRYQEVLGERPVPWSNAKVSGDSRSPLLTGALARLENAGGLLPEAGFPALPAAGIHANNAAQAVEIVWALAQARRLARGLADLPGGEAVKAPVRPGPGRGTCVIEAPRGLLIHHYTLDDSGRVAVADIVTPTAINQAAMEAQLMTDLAEVEDEAELRDRAARIVRAYDPCISCSVHLLRV